jgi:alcohol dehydrogenase class IV
MRLRLRDLGCKLEDAHMIAELAIKTSPYLSVHPTPMDAKAVAKIYCDSF